MKTVAALEIEKKQGIVSIFGKSIKIEQRLEDLKKGEKPEVIRTVVPFVAKSIDDAERTIRFVGSTATVDRYGDVIVQTGWDLAHWLKNPVIPWGHNYSQPPVAMGLEAELEHGDLTFTGKFPTIGELSSDPDHPSDWALFADAIYNGYKGGYLRAFSVGFIPTEYEGNWQDGYIFKECELLEVSCVTVPANPEALVLAFAEGKLSKDHRKALIRQAEKLIKSLTENDLADNNEVMEKQLAELKAGMEQLTKTVNDLVAALTAKKDAEEDPKPADDKETPEENPEDKPADDADGGAGGDDELDVDEEDVKSIVGGAVEEALKYETGKID